MTGKIARIVSERGFGFIKPDNSTFKKDVFFHCSKLGNVEFDALQVGDAVTFETEEGEKGLCAVGVCVP